MNKLKLISGPCAAESSAQMDAVARGMKSVLAEAAEVFSPVFRAGLWKPRSQPSTFQGVGAKGLPWLTAAASAIGCPAATEVAQPEHLTAAYEAGIRHFWIGARTTANPFMVEALAAVPLANKQSVTWYVKNPTSPDIDLWCGAVERLNRAGYSQVCAIHRGFVLGEHTTSVYRNAPVWSVAIEFKRRYPGTPLLTDASHIAGQAGHVAEVAEQAIRMGMDGLMIEVHTHPEQALSDPGQQLTPDALHELLKRVAQIRTTDNGDEHAELTALRQQIDETDDELWALLSKRLDIARQIGDYKRRHGLSVLQQARYEEILQRRLTWAAEHGIDPESAKQIMDIIHEQSVLTQL